MVEDRLKQFGEIKVSEIMLVGNEVITVTPDEKVSTTELLMLKKKSAIYFPQNNMRWASLGLYM